MVRDDPDDGAAAAAAAAAADGLKQEPTPRPPPPSEEPAGAQGAPRGSQGGADAWRRGVNGADADTFPTHLRSFRSAAEYKLVKSTFLHLQSSGYYWGAMTMEEAHKTLTSAPLGTFLVRDSGRPDVFFTLSYRSDDGPTSVRVQLSADLLFSLCGSRRTFTSLFALLAFYTSSSCKLTVPYRRQRPERLKQMCRRAVVRTYGAETISSIAGLSGQEKDYVHAYPYCI